MSLSRLLLVAASSKKYIVGKGGDKIIITPKAPLPGSGRDLYEGEVVLFFQLDDTRDTQSRERIARSLSIQDDAKRCDGLIFYAQDGSEEKVICLVEMKSTAIKDAAEQIKSTRDHIKQLLQQECSDSDTCSRQLSHIQWKACFYHHGSSPSDVGDILKQLRNANFSDVAGFSSSNNDVGPLLRGKESAKDMAKKIRSGKRR